MIPAGRELDRVDIARWAHSWAPLFRFIIGVAAPMIVFLIHDLLPVSWRQVRSVDAALTLTLLLAGEWVFFVWLRRRLGPVLLDLGPRAGFNAGYLVIALGMVGLVVLLVEGLLAARYAGAWLIGALVPIDIVLTGYFFASGRFELRKNGTLHFDTMVWWEEIVSYAWHNDKLMIVAKGAAEREHWWKVDPCQQAEIDAFLAQFAQAGEAPGA